jgi:hypothetical protein
MGPFGVVGPNLRPSLPPIGERRRKGRRARRRAVANPGMPPGVFDSASIRAAVVLSKLGIR